MLDVSMISLKIESNELSSVHNLKFRGKHSTVVPGKGIGLYVIDRAMEIMQNDKLHIVPNYDKTEIYDDEIYVENHFKLFLSI
jgi:hypothetical protein